MISVVASQLPDEPRQLDGDARDVTNASPGGGKPQLKSISSSIQEQNQSYLLPAEPPPAPPPPGTHSTARTRCVASSSNVPMGPTAGLTARRVRAANGVTVAQLMAVYVTPEPGVQAQYSRPVPDCDRSCLIFIDLCNTQKASRSHTRNPWGLKTVSAVSNP